MKFDRPLSGHYFFEVIKLGEKKIIVENIPVEKIKVNTKENRKISRVKLLQLQDSIATQGLLNPITVEQVKNDDTYEYLLLAGERRFTACKDLGWKNIPAHIIEYGSYVNEEEPELNDNENDTNDIKRQYVRLAENLSRQDMDEYEKAKAVQHLYGGGKISYRKLAAKLGVSKSYIEKLCKMTNEVSNKTLGTINIQLNDVKRSVKNINGLLEAEITKENVEQLKSELDKINTYYKKTKAELLINERQRKKQGKEVNRSQSMKKEETRRLK